MTDAKRIRDLCSETDRLKGALALKEEAAEALADGLATAAEFAKEETDRASALASRVEGLTSELSRLNDLDVLRLQMPDGSVAEGIEQAVRGWKAGYDEVFRENLALRRDLKAEVDGAVAMRSDLGARDSETMAMFLGRIVGEATAATSQLEDLQEQLHRLANNPNPNAEERGFAVMAYRNGHVAAAADDLVRFSSALVRLADAVDVVLAGGSISGPHRWLLKRTRDNVRNETEAADVIVPAKLRQQETL